MLLENITTYLDKVLKKDTALSWDNCGLLIGDLKKEISRILISLDINSGSIDFAIKNKVNLIISHHPLIFNPLKKITSQNITQKMVMDLIRNDISVYSAHTNIDIADFGISSRIIKMLELKHIGYLEPFSDRWYKFAVFVPLNYEKAVRDAMCKAGGGVWKDYSCCTFRGEGIGTFKPGSRSNPFVGSKNELTEVNEVKLECIVRKDNLNELVSSVMEAHPYEEPAYDIYPIENKFLEGGIGEIGEFDKPLIINDFLKLVKFTFGLKNLRFVFGKSSGNVKITKVLVINGSANSVIEGLSVYEFDALLCGEISYHNCALLLENEKLVVEMGHYESEWIFTDIMSEILERYKLENNPDIVIYKSSKPQNFWRYFIE